MFMTLALCLLAGSYLQVEAWTDQSFPDDGHLVKAEQDSWKVADEKHERDDQEYRGKPKKQKSF